MAVPIPVDAFPPLPPRGNSERTYNLVGVPAATMPIPRVALKPVEKPVTKTARHILHRWA